MINERTATSTIIDGLRAIWQRALQRTCIGVEDDFFALGGNPAAANAVFSEIAQEYGRELSPLTIYQAPTVAQLAAILEEPTLPRLTPLVLLKAGCDGPPIFLVPGLGGSVMEFFQLVGHLESRHPIYGMQSRGMDGVEEPFERIEDLAQYYLDAIRALQSSGPYILIGYSLGGLVSLEMAQRLSRQGEKIALLSMVESYPHPNRLPLGQRAGTVKRRAKRSISTILRRAGFRSHVSEDSGESVLDKPRVGEKWTLIMDRARRIAYVTWQRYHPEYYEGQIKFVRATAIDPQFPDDPNEVWAKLAAKFTVETMPGDHFGGLGAHSKTLAAILSRYLKEIGPCAMNGAS